MKKIVANGMGVLFVLAFTLAGQAAVIDENFTGGSFSDLGWYNEQGWSINNTASRAEYDGGAANGWQWIEKSFDPQVAKGWQLDFDYEWQWGDHAPWDNFRVEMLDNLGAQNEARDGYALEVYQGNGGGDTFFLERVNGSNYMPADATIASGVGYDDSGCQFGPPVWKTVRLTWDASTNTLTAYKVVNGQFVQVLSVVDTTFSNFANLRFNETYTAGECNWITNVHLTAVPEPATVSLLALGLISLVRRRYNG